ncbi:MAG: hypothetical protein ACFCVH_07640 [Alphaproteobacteria bacterium]
MTTWQRIALGLTLAITSGMAAGCVTESELAAGPTVADQIAPAEATVIEQQPAAAQLARLVEASQPTRTEEGGVTVIRGPMPPALAALASPMPVSAPQQALAEPRPVGPATGGSLVAAALNQGGAVPTSAAPGALASGGQLAALRAQPSIPVEVAELAVLETTAPAGGTAAATALTQAEDPIVEEVRRLAAMSPTSIAELEARGATRLTTEAITALSVGNTLTHTHAGNGFSVATYFDPSGESRLINDGRALPGRYQIIDGARCRIDMEGLGICAVLYREGETTWVCDQRDEGACNWYVSRVEPGLVGG